ncbi:hypothetical protein GCM10027417_17230 [Glutamicibacter endophyticus]
MLLDALQDPPFRNRKPGERKHFLANTGVGPFWILGHDGPSRSDGPRLFATGLDWFRDRSCGVHRQAVTELGSPNRGMGKLHPTDQCGARLVWNLPKDPAS